jgi:hypothetical protein
MKKSLIVLFVLSMGVLLNLAVPPFQNPDEPLHFATVLKYAHNGDDTAAQKGIIALMDTHSFWRLLGIGRPLAAPERLNEIKYVVGNYSVADYSELIKGLPLYYLIAGKILRRLSGGDIAAAYFLARLMSFLFFALAAYFFYLTFRRIVGGVAHAASDTPPSSAPAALSGGSWLYLGFFFILFLPQLLLTSMAVNPDCLGLLIGSVFFYAAFSVLRGENGGWGRTALSIVAYAAAIFGALVDNSLLPLILFAGVMFLFSLTRKNWQNTIVLLLFLSVVAILAVYFITLLFPLQREKAYLYVRDRIIFGFSSVKSIFARSAFNRSFLVQLTDTFFLRFGWLVFGPARLVDWAWRGFVLAAMAGIGVYLSRPAAFFVKRRLKEEGLIKAEISLNEDLRIASRVNSTAAGAPGFTRGSTSAAKARPLTLPKLVLFSIIVVGIQIFGIRIFAGADNLYSQGRYLFPVIAPVTLLFSLGIKSLFDLAGKKWSAGGLALRVLILAMFIFLSFAVLNYVIPVFHLTIKSPYPGL